MDTTTTKRKTPKISEYESKNESPYTVEIHSKYLQAAPEHRAVEIDGILHGIYEIPKGKTVSIDTAMYSKVFKGNTSVLMEMSEPAAKMFYYILENIQTNRDEICILREDYLKFAGYKIGARLTYYRAVEGLLYARIISRKTGSGMCYWVNPNILFNGDRTKLKNIIVKPPL
jgi:hypothetical protein